MSVRSLSTIVAVALLGLATPAVAQLGQSDSYKFLQAIKDAKGDDVTKFLDKPGTTIVNTRDRINGEGALHIVARRGDDTYVRYLLAKGADANIRDNNGNTPLMIAVTSGYIGLIDAFAKNGGNVNLANHGGETPLIRAVQRRDAEMVRTLLADGADPDQADHLQGSSARDYAHLDPRGGAIAKLIDETPKKPQRAVAGPKFR